MRSNGRIEGHIKGIRLPRRTWLVLEKERIGTLAQLADMAPRIERIIPGIGQTTAKAIREELKAVILSEAEPRPIGPCRARVSPMRSAERLATPTQGTPRSRLTAPQPFTIDPACRAMMIWLAVCPRCGASEVRSAEDATGSKA